MCIAFCWSRCRLPAYIHWHDVRWARSSTYRRARAFRKGITVFGHCYSVERPRPLFRDITIANRSQLANCHIFAIGQIYEHQSHRAPADSSNTIPRIQLANKPAIFASLARARLDQLSSSREKYGRIIYAINHATGLKRFITSVST